MLCAVCCAVLLHRLSALEAVIEDGHSLHITQNPSINPQLLDHISLVYSKAASSLAHMSQTVRAYGSSSNSGSNSRGSSNSGGNSSGSGNSGSGGPVTSPAMGVGKGAVDAVCGRAAESQHCWQQAKAKLAAQMHQECEGHWTDVLHAAADSPVILPTLTGVSVTCAYCCAACTYCCAACTYCCAAVTPRLLLHWRSCYKKCVCPPGLRHLTRNQLLTAFAIASKQRCVFLTAAAPSPSCTALACLRLVVTQRLCTLLSPAALARCGI